LLADPDLALSRQDLRSAARPDRFAGGGAGADSGGDLLDDRGRALLRDPRARRRRATAATRPLPPRAHPEQRRDDPARDAAFLRARRAVAAPARAGDVAAGALGARLRPRAEGGADDRGPR